MTIDKTELHYRKHALQRWRKHYENEGKKVTDEEIHSFIAGFNMGWKCHKTKVFPRLPTKEQIGGENNIDPNQLGNVDFSSPPCISNDEKRED